MEAKQFVSVSLEKFLTPKALKLSESHLVSPAYEFNVQVKTKELEAEFERHYVTTRTAVKKVPLKYLQTVDDYYLRKWANFLNDMAERNIWQFGVLGNVCMLLPLAVSSLERQAYIFSLLFTGLRNKDKKQDSVEELNKLVGTNVFVNEGCVPEIDEDWTKFPW